MRIFGGESSAFHQCRRIVGKSSKLGILIIPSEELQKYKMRKIYGFRLN